MNSLRSHLLTVASVLLWAATGLCQSGDLVPISPQEEQGMRDVQIRFRSSDPEERLRQETLDQEEELPSPQPRDNESPRFDEDVDTSFEKDSATAGETIRQRYPDGKTQILRHVRQDEFGNYFNAGPWKLFNRTGQVMAEGEFAEGLMEGTWTRWHPADAEGVFRIPPFPENQGPFLSVASFHRGKLDGMWTIYDRNRRKLFEMQYVNGLRDGSARWWNSQGGLAREMHFQKGLLHGAMIEYDARQNPAKTTEYLEGRRIYSEVTHHRPKAKKTEDFYLDAQLTHQGEDNWWDARPAEYSREGESVRHGASRAWYENGQPRMEGFYQLGKKHGTFTWWHANGQKQAVGQFRDDLKEGDWTWWHENGMKAVQGQYAANQVSGKWSWWDTNGKIIRSGDASAIEQAIELPATDDLPILSPPDAESLEEIAPNLTAPDGQ